MEIRVDIAGWKKVYKENLPSFWRKKIENSLTFPNPAYEGMRVHNPHALRALEKKGEAPFPILRFFRQTEEYYLVPRHFSLGADEVVWSDLRCRVPAVFPEPNFGLWPIQTEAINAWKEAQNPNGIIVIPTGSGKCILGLEMARRLKQKTLILVDRDKAGAGNWIKDCKAYLGFAPGRIQGKNLDLEPPVVVGTFQTLHSRNDLLRELKRAFGCIIIDEVQVTPATTYVRVVNSFHARYRYGETATPDREDELGAITYHTMGDILFDRRVADEIVPASVKVVRTGIKIPTVVDKRTQKSELLFSGDYNKSLKWLCTNEARNGLLLRKVVELGAGHYNLCVTHRVWHVKVFANALAEVVGPEKVAILATGIKGKDPRGWAQVTLNPKINHNQGDVIDRTRCGEYPFIVGTYQYVYKNLDVPIWDALHMLTPVKRETELIQVIGRIRRKCKETNKERAFVTDYVDANGMWQGRFSKRKRVYAQLERQASNQQELF